MPKHLQPDLLTQAPKDIVALTMGACAKLTAPLGNTALGMVLGSQGWHTAVAVLDAAALAGDLAATKEAGRAIIHGVRGMVESAIQEPTARERHPDA
jgi:hypothetical protein